mgnify:CR=1 FL=1
MPIFGICRGIQEINVAFGGTLFYRVHHESGKTDHRMPQNEEALLEDIFKPRHIVNFKDGSFLKKILGQSQFSVNSLHGQGIDQLGKGLVVEAHSEDGLIEALSIEGYQSFGLGIQWHPEFHPEREENSINKILDMAEKYYASGLLGLSYLPARNHLAIGIAAIIYRQIGRKLLKLGTQWWMGRQVIGMFEKIIYSFLVIPTLFKRFREFPDHDTTLHIPLKRFLYVNGNPRY